MVDISTYYEHSQVELYLSTEGEISTLTLVPGNNFTARKLSNECTELV